MKTPQMLREISTERGGCGFRTLSSLVKEQRWLKAGQVDFELWHWNCFFISSCPTRRKEITLLLQLVIEWQGKNCLENERETLVQWQGFYS